MLDNDPRKIRETLTGRRKTLLTLTSKKTGRSITYRVSQARDKRTRIPQERWFVGRLSGPDPENAEYSYLGVLDRIRSADGVNPAYRTTSASRVEGTDKIASKAFSYFWEHLVQDKIAPDLEVLCHERKSKKTENGNAPVAIQVINDEGKPIGEPQVVDLGAWRKKLRKPENVS